MTWVAWAVELNWFSLETLRSRGRVQWARGQRKRSAGRTPVRPALRYALRTSTAGSGDGGGGGGARGEGVADGVAGGGVEEVQLAGVDGQLDGLAGADQGAGGDPGGPQRLAAGQRGDGVVFLIMPAGRAGDRGVLHRRGG